MKITDCFAKETLDSRGKPTLKVFLRSGDKLASVKVPSGKSAGSHEAVELRDPDGIRVSKTIEVVKNIIAPAIVGKAPEQRQIDSILLNLDGTTNKSHLGGNSMIGVSMAAALLLAEHKGVPLWKSIAEENKTTPSQPALYMNVINGGVHADFRLPFQEYIVVLSEETPRKSYELGKKIFQNLGEKIKEKYGEVPMGDEGGYSPKVSSIEEPFALLTEVLEGEKIFLACDVAASEVYSDGQYKLGDTLFSTEELANVYKNLLEKFSLKSIEDPFAEDEIDAFSLLLEEISKNSLVVGDDLTVTNPARIKEMIQRKAANAVIIKPNQIGTLTETYEAVRLAKEVGWKIIVSHRSGDTPDAFIADLAVGLGAYGIKAGSPIPLERKAKYERLIEISEKEGVTL